MTGIRLCNDPNLFGKLPDPPEPVDCDGKFEEEKCMYCLDYNICKREWEDDG